MLVLFRLILRIGIGRWEYRHQQTLFEAFYNLTNERFVKLSQSYEQEQIDLEAKVKSLQTQMSEELETRLHVDMFLSKIHKYIQITELSTIMLNELIERVEVYERDKRYDKNSTQRIKVRFNYLGDVSRLVLPPDPPPEKIQVISAEKG